ncbi:MAG: hypothetical protein EB824_06345, partial [Thaumarchaeota archaeon S15]
MVAESSARLKTLVDHVYYKYVSQGLSMDADAGMGTLVLPPSTSEILMYVRYITIELGDFAEMYMRNRDWVEAELDGRGLCALYSLVEGQAGTAGLVSGIRDGLGGDSGMTLRELGSMVNPDQLEQLLLYARLVVEFQGRLTGGSMGEGGFTRQEWSQILDVPKPRPIDQAQALKDELARNFPGIDMGQHLRACSIMYERWEGMRTLREMLEDCLVKFEAGSSFNTLTLTWASYMLKYMIMDIAEFAQRHKTLGLETRAGFAQNLERYRAIYGKYFAGNARGEAEGAARLVRGERGLLTMVLNDVEEAEIFIDQIRAGFASAYSMPNRPLYSPDLVGVNERFEQA